MAKAAIYCRLSDEDRNKQNVFDESESIQNQKNMLIKYVFEKEWEIYDIYCDEDLSGAGTYRPDFERMINDAENKKFDIVLCKTQARFSREMEVIEKYLHNKFVEWDIRFVTLIDRVDTYDESNKKTRQITGLVDEWFLEDLSKNIKSVLRNKKADGKYTGPFFPYGYKKDPENKNKLIIDEPAASVVRRIFDMFLAGNSYNKIASELNRGEIPVPMEYKKIYHNINIASKAGAVSGIWSGEIVKKILKNPVYNGTMIQGKTATVSYKNHRKKTKPKHEWIIVENTHDPVIENGKWDKVNNVLIGRSREGKYTGDVNIFSQKVYCSQCGSVFHKCSSNGYEYLRCKTVGKDKNYCNNISRIRICELQDMVVKEINTLIEEYKDVHIINENFEFGKVNMYRKAEERQHKNLSEKLIKNRKIFKRLYEDMIDGIITEEEFKQLKNDFCRETELLNKEMFLADKKGENRTDEKEIIENFSGIEKLNTFLIENFIEKIILYPKNPFDKSRKIEINWKI